MLSLKRLRRLYKIMKTVGYYRLDQLVDPDKVPSHIRLALACSPWRWRTAPTLSRGERLRLALEELGPVFIKFGQMLSTRQDLLAPDIAEELTKLQDKVPPFPEQQSIAIIEEALGNSVEHCFASFDATPLASASVAQVHTATLLSGESVVVKVVRPDIEVIIKQDIALLFTLAKLAAKYLRDGRRLHPVELVADYEIIILDELDLTREAANASQLRRNFAGNKLVYVPEVYWDYSCRNVLVCERIYGIPVTDLAALKRCNTDLKLLAERGVEIFFTQVFRDSFFHADMHPGNIFVDATDPADPTYIAVDCAIVGSLSDADQHYLGRNLLAIFKRDYREVAQLHIECGWVPADTKLQDFEAAMRAVCEPVFERPLGDISFGQLLIYLFQTARRFDMEIQPSLVLLQKTMLSIEGLGRQLYPQLNLWDTAQPYLERWMHDRLSAESIVKRLQRQAPSWLEQLPQLPDVVLNRLLQPPVDTTGIKQPKEPRPAMKSRIFLPLAALSGLLALIAAQPGINGNMAEIPTTTWVLLALTTALLWPRLK